MTTPPGPSTPPSGESLPPEPPGGSPAFPDPAGAPAPPFGDLPPQAPPSQVPGPGGYPAPTGYPAPVGYPQPEQGRNGLAIAGLILAILFAPLGFVLSLIGFIQAGKRGQKGRGMALAGMIIGFAFSAIGIAIVVVAGLFIGKNITTVADPGCIKGKEVILTATDVPQNDPAAARQHIQNVVTGLDEAISKSEHDSVRKALQAIRGDFATLVKSLDTGTLPPSDLETQVQAHANRVDELCTIGGADTNN